MTMYFEVKYRWGNRRGTLRLHADSEEQVIQYAEELLRDDTGGRRTPKIRQFEVSLIDADIPWDMLPGQELP